MPGPVDPDKVRGTKHPRVPDVPPITIETPTIYQIAHTTGEVPKPKELKPRDAPKEELGQILIVAADTIQEKLLRERQMILLTTPILSPVEKEDLIQKLVRERSSRTGGGARTECELFRAVVEGRGDYAVFYLPDRTGYESMTRVIEESIANGDARTATRILREAMKRPHSDHALYYSGIVRHALFSYHKKTMDGLNELASALEAIDRNPVFHLDTVHKGFNAQELVLVGISIDLTVREKHDEVMKGMARYAIQRGRATPLLPEVDTQPVSESGLLQTPSREVDIDALIRDSGLGLGGPGRRQDGVISLDRLSDSRRTAATGEELDERMRESLWVMLDMLSDRGKLEFLERLKRVSSSQSLPRSTIKEGMTNVLSRSRQVDLERMLLSWTSSGEQTFMNNLQALEAPTATYWSLTSPELGLLRDTLAGIQHPEDRLLLLNGFARLHRYLMTEEDQQGEDYLRLRSFLESQRVLKPEEHLQTKGCLYVGKVSMLLKDNTPRTPEESAKLLRFNLLHQLLLAKVNDLINEFDNLSETEKTRFIDRFKAKFNEVLWKDYDAIPTRPEGNTTEELTPAQIKPLIALTRIVDPAERLPSVAELFYSRDSLRCFTYDRPGAEFMISGAGIASGHSSMGNDCRRASLGPRERFFENLRLFEASTGRQLRRIEHESQDPAFSAYRAELSHPEEGSRARTLDRKELEHQQHLNDLLGLMTDDARYFAGLSRATLAIAGRSEDAAREFWRMYCVTPADISMDGNITYSGGVTEHIDRIADPEFATRFIDRLDAVRETQKLYEVTLRKRHQADLANFAERLWFAMCRSPERLDIATTPGLVEGVLRNRSDEGMLQGFLGHLEDGRINMARAYATWFMTPFGSKRRESLKILTSGEVTEPDLRGVTFTPENIQQELSRIRDEKKARDAERRKFTALFDAELNPEQRELYSSISNIGGLPHTEVMTEVRLREFLTLTSDMPQESRTGMLRLAASAQSYETATALLNSRPLAETLQALSQTPQTAGVFLEGLGARADYAPGNIGTIVSEVRNSEQMRKRHRLESAVDWTGFRGDRTPVMERLMTAPVEDLPLLIALETADRILTDGNAFIQFARGHPHLQPDIRISVSDKGKVFITIPAGE